MDDPECYEVHLPCIFNKTKLRKFFAENECRGILFRSFFFNQFPNEDKYYREDKKHKTEEDIITEDDFVSISNMFTKTYEYKQKIENRFNKKCRYEK